MSRTGVSRPKLDVSKSMAPSAHHSTNRERFAVIAGNGRFPFLVLDAARDQGINPLVVAIKEEASPELSRSAREVRWLSLGDVSKLLDVLDSERVTKVL